MRDQHVVEQQEVARLPRERDRLVQIRSPDGVDHLVFDGLTVAVEGVIRQPIPPEVIEQAQGIPATISAGELRPGLGRLKNCFRMQGSACPSLLFKRALTTLVPSRNGHVIRIPVEPVNTSLFFG